MGSDVRSREVNRYIYPANTRFGPPRKPDSALSRHPSPGISPGLLLEELRLPARTPHGAGTIWLARTGGLPGRPLAGYRRWALTPPFHPSPVPGDRASEPSAGLLSVALDVTEAGATPPLGLLTRAAVPGRSFQAPALASPDFSLRPYRPSAATGRTARTLALIIPQPARCPIRPPGHAGRRGRR